MDVCYVHFVVGSPVVTSTRLPVLGCVAACQSSHSAVLFVIISGLVSSLSQLPHLGSEAALAERLSAERLQAERMALTADPLLRLQMAGLPPSAAAQAAHAQAQAHAAREQQSQHAHTHTHAHAHTHLHLHQPEAAGLLAPPFPRRTTAPPR